MSDVLGHPPYEGRFDEVVPHLTVGECRLGTIEQLRLAEREVQDALPVRVRVEHVDLLAGSDAPGSWRTVRRLPLGSEAGRGDRG